MAVAFVTSGVGANWTGTTIGTIATSAFPLSAGQFVIIVANDILPPGVVITDTAGNSYIPGSAGPSLPFWYAKNTLANAANVVTATFPPQAFVYLVAIVFSGVDLVNPIDQVAGAQSSSVQNPFTPSVNTQFAQEAAITWVDSSDTLAGQGGGWAFVSNPGSSAQIVQYQILAAKQAIAGAATESTLNLWLMGMVTIVGAGQRLPPAPGDMGPAYDLTFRI